MVSSSRVEFFLLLEHFFSWWRDHYVASKRHDSITQWRGATSQNNGDIQLTISLRETKNIGNCKTQNHFLRILSTNSLQNLLEENRRHENTGSWFASAVVEEIKTHISWSITLYRKSCRLWDNVQSTAEPGRWQYGACALYAGYLRLQIHTQII
jgi:hypothetical protein